MSENMSSDKIVNDGVPQRDTSVADWAFTQVLAAVTLLDRDRLLLSSALGVVVGAFGPEVIHEVTWGPFKFEDRFFVFVPIFLIAINLYFLVNFLLGVWLDRGRWRSQITPSLLRLNQERLEVQKRIAELNTAAVLALRQSVDASKRAQDLQSKSRTAFGKRVREIQERIPKGLANVPVEIEAAERAIDEEFEAAINKAEEEAKSLLQASQEAQDAASAAEKALPSADPVFAARRSWRWQNRLFITVPSAFSLGSIALLIYRIVA